MNPFTYFAKPTISPGLASVIKAAQERARSYSQDYVGVEHVFLCLRDLPESEPATAILRLLPIDLPAFWSELESGSQAPTGRPIPAVLPQTPRLRLILEHAGRWAKQANPKEITTALFLAAVCNERSSFVAQVFRQVSARNTSTFSDAHAAAAYFAMSMNLQDSKLFQGEEHA